MCYIKVSRANDIEFTRKGEFDRLLKLCNEIIAKIKYIV